MTDTYWAKLHAMYSDKDWIHKPSLFAETVRDHIPKAGKLLDLGAGLGQDSIFFNELGYEVTSTDLNVDRLQELVHDEFEVRVVDLRQLLPFSDAHFDIVYAHVSLHYFDEQVTRQIFDEIYRVLKPGGVVAFFTNSIDDPEYGTGVHIEPDYYEIDGTPKRYFSVATAKQFAHNFQPLLADNDGETYKDRAKGIHNLIRYVGTKA